MINRFEANAHKTATVLLLEWLAAKVCCCCNMRTLKSRAKVKTTKVTAVSCSATVLKTTTTTQMTLVMSNDLNFKCKQITQAERIIFGTQVT